MSERCCEEVWNFCDKVGLERALWRRAPWIQSEQERQTESRFVKWKTLLRLRDKMFVRQETHEQVSPAFKLRWVPLKPVPLNLGCGLI